MDNMNYDDFDELPFILKILTLLLYFAPVPLIFIAAINLFMVRIDLFNLSDSFWLISTAIVLGLALFSYMSALGINRMKQWVPNFFHAGICLIILALLGALYFGVTFFSFVEINLKFVSPVIAGLTVCSIIIESNRKIFSN